jgi:hypothetical protein
MTIVEVLKLNKPFKRAGWSNALFPKNDYQFTKEDLMATDWELPEPTILVNKKSLSSAWVLLVESHIDRDPDGVFNAFVQELGL